MKKVTKKQGKSIIQGIYTTSTMPHHKDKRIRKTTKEEESKIINFECSINEIGFLSAAVVGLWAPLPADWKTLIVILFLITAVHFKKEEV